MAMVKACLSNELSEGTMRSVEIMERNILLIRVSGAVYAIDGICPEDGGNLADGVIYGNLIKCPYMALSSISAQDVLSKGLGTIRAESMTFVHIRPKRIVDVFTWNSRICNDLAK